MIQGSPTPRTLEAAAQAYQVLGDPADAKRMLARARSGGGK
jgi:hypothetical protein